MNNTNEIPHITLQNGARVPEPVAQTTLMSLELLATTNPIALYELVQLARDSRHDLFGNTGDVLAELGLVDHAGDGFSLPPTTRDVILGSRYASEMGDL